MKRTIFNTPLLTPILRVISVAILRLRGWRITGDPPPEARYIMIAGPHTSNWDFPYMLMSVFATGLDISANGRTMAVATMLNGVVVRRQPDESWSAAFSRPGTVISLPPRRQGETICFDLTGQYLFLNSEEKKQPLWRMNVP